AATAAAAPIIDAVVGEKFDFLPMAASSPVARPVADTVRSIVLDLLAPFGDSSERAMSGPVRTVGVASEKPGHASNRPYIAPQLSARPDALRVGARVLRKRPGVLYQVAEILPSTPGFARLDLNIIKVA